MPYIIGRIVNSDVTGRGEQGYMIGNGVTDAYADGISVAKFKVDKFLIPSFLELRIIDECGIKFWEPAVPGENLATS